MIKKRKDELSFDEESETKEEIIETVLDKLEETIQERSTKPIITDEYREEVKLKKTCFKIIIITDTYIVAHNDLKGNVWVKLSDISNPVIGKEIYR